MMRLATAIAAIALIGTPAFAQAPPPAPVYNWTGWYAGVNAGASFGSTRTDFNNAPVFSVNPPGFTTPLTQLTLGFANPDDEVYPGGFIGGGQIGYNWQYSPLIVVGLEADIQGALERATGNWSQSFIGPILFPNANLSSLAAATSYTTQIDWFGTVRGRIGYVWGGGTVLSYVTGGLAYGEVKINGTNTVSANVGSINVIGVLSATDTFSQSHVNTGWVVGYGTEGVIDFWGARNWTWKIEGLYMDLGTLDATGPSSIACTSAICARSVAPGTTYTGGQVTTNSHFTDGILRAGLNYKFY
jgi:outer membrane immunogenic protein